MPHVVNVCKCYYGLEGEMNYIKRSVYIKIRSNEIKLCPKPMTPPSPQGHLELSLSIIVQKVVL